MRLFLNISPDFVSCGKLVMSTLWLKLYIIYVVYIAGNSVYIRCVYCRQLLCICVVYIVGKGAFDVFVQACRGQQQIPHLSSDRSCFRPDDLHF